MAVASAQSPRCLDDCLYRVRFGSLAAATVPILGGRFTSKSGLCNGRVGMSATRLALDGVAVSYDQRCRLVCSG